jgi:hypothetical protein
LLRYLRDHTYFGVTFYSDIERASVTKMLDSQKVALGKLFYTFSDSSWNDDVDTGRSTGCFLIFYMGGVVDHNSNLPNPVALSSAEAEYNECCLACMATNHLAMLVEEFELKGAERSLIPLILDSKSAIAMGNSFRDTKHTRHIMRRFHYVREGVESKRFILCWIQTELELADIGTKQTPGPRQTLLTNLLLVPVQDGNNTIASIASFVVDSLSSFVQHKRGDSDHVGRDALV